MKKFQEQRVYEFRIRYNAHRDHSALDTFHYYMAVSAEEAYKYHLYSLLSKGLEAQSISIEKKNPWTGKWELEDF